MFPIDDLVFKNYMSNSPEREGGGCFGFGCQELSASCSYVQIEIVGLFIHLMMQSISPESFEHVRDKQYESIKERDDRR